MDNAQLRETVYYSWFFLRISLNLESDEPNWWFILGALGYRNPRRTAAAWRDPQPSLQLSAWEHMAERLKRKHAWKPISVWGRSVSWGSDTSRRGAPVTAVMQTAPSLWRPRGPPATCGGWPGCVRSAGWWRRPRCDVCCHRALKRSQKTEALELIPGRMGPPSQTYTNTPPAKLNAGSRTRPKPRTSDISSSRLWKNGRNHPNWRWQDQLCGRLKGQTRSHRCLVCLKPTNRSAPKKKKATN